ncbi:hypothetical protein VaNZ11_008402 [Volvox africanus]|uniref:U-box domain-containing protein n=1 Tax=Volvox africanus TaxID=51714 RepID=A0ABQ5S6B5_9CHLO|nr:hypothetical protein VaNZ11_008402 [Volvox africanus]
MENGNQQEPFLNQDMLLDDNHVLRGPGLRARQINGVIRGILKSFALCGAGIVLIYFFPLKTEYTSLWGLGLGAHVSDEISQPGVGTPRPVLKLKYSSYHPFNIIYRMSLQTIFGIQGETVANIPMIYSNYELEVVLRTLNNSGPSRNWTDLVAFADQEPTAAYMYGAALLTLPRTTLFYVWLHDHHDAYNLFTSMNLDLLEAGKKLAWHGLQVVLHAIGVTTTRDTIKHPTSDAGKMVSSPAFLPEVGEVAVSAPAPVAQSMQGIGWVLWPLMSVCPGIMTCYLALAFAETVPGPACWIFFIGFLRVLCEMRLLIHVGILTWRRHPQEAVHALASNYGIQYILGCHGLLLLRLAGALLPPRLFLYLSFYLYSTCVPLVFAGVTIMALDPMNANMGAMDGFVGHQRGAEERHQTPNADNAGASDATGLSRHHWPPPIDVPVELQETTESVPKHLLCPITHHILTEPAVTSTGATYERAAIIEWLTKAGKDPITGRTVSPSEVHPNLAMYNVVEEYVLTYKKAAEDMPVTIAGC